ncbi:NfeD family protein [Pullulanibacillus sp. KACC 23026]|uniref:NfeD family protein n=1 Tax=Pullulanibacillus sp. KACC 23026 TaxID=3028315 RepID=UPI0023B06710|nr:NfeD family protein [Pullulanibacillus sp. KACC 23026]WEG14257.1 NfeD family protein [Pullulanibacillus sp. KACC 23026]
MALFQDPLFGFCVIGIATFLLAGECLVKAKGLFGLIGFVLYILYLYSQLTDHSSYWLIAVMAVGVIFVVLDGVLITNGTVAIIGLVSIMLALAVASPSLPYGIGVSVAFWVGLFLSLLLIKTMPARTFWRRLALFDQSTSEAGYNSLNEETKLLIGKTGLTVSVLRPVGTIEIDGERYSAMTNGEWVQSGIEVLVTDVDGTKIVVKPLSIELEK